MSHLKLFAQNLIPNPSFEDINICTEYNAPCAPSAWWCIAPFGAYFVYNRNPSVAYNGENYAYIIMGSRKNPINRSFLQTQLLCPLIANQRYLLTFYLQIPNRKFENIGILLTPKDLFKEEMEQGTDPAIKYRPSFIITKKDILTKIKKDQWLKVQYVYIANGQEKYFIIGNFDNEITNRSHSQTYKRVSGYLIYYMDDISLVPVNKNIQPCVNISKTRMKIYNEHYRHSFPKLTSDQGVDIIPKDSNTIIPKIDTLIIPDILFAFDSSSINREFIPLLDTIIEKIKLIHYRNIVINGYTDNRGTKQYNEHLSYQRAAIIADYLMTKDTIPADKIIINGKGESNPIAPNESKVGRKKNRRVEIILYEQ